MTILKDSPGAGHFILSEANGYRSRQRMTVGLAQTLLAGQVLGKLTTGGDYVKLAPAASDGSQTVAGIAFDDYVTTTEKVDGVSFERDGEVTLDKLVWPAGITDVQKTAAVAALAAKGVLARV
ncbi:head decoration protein [Brevundimonas sp.]|uniref:head decoration protein n=1 Tax=Brevundimonas sp. TaxID=1871086 RepID=UPI00120C9B28|nr:head decoration protein [Brevundimonas sp.]MCG2662867.1 head decoration protein [Brevundimonas sp.]TAJ46023.1 MAG: head decoration protein [Brevundimonas sp.]